MILSKMSPFARAAANLGRSQAPNRLSVTTQSRLAMIRSLSISQQARGDFCDVVRDEGSPVATVRLNSAPVNSMSLELMRELEGAIAGLEADKTCRGLVLASAVPRVFSAGLDINEMWNPEEDRLRQFWQSVQSLWLRLYSSPLATVAAIEGNSPAGGCMMAMCCDSRIMSTGDDSKGSLKPYVIGLNETKLGIVAPFWFVDTLVNTVNSRRTAERMLQRGDLLSSQEALGCQLVDFIVPTSDVMATAEAEMNQLLSVPDMARHESKMAIRQPAIDRLRAQQQMDEEKFVAFAMSDGVQHSLTRYMEALKARSSKKK